MDRNCSKLLLLKLDAQELQVPSKYFHPSETHEIEILLKFAVMTPKERTSPFDIFFAQTKDKPNSSI